jgi:hypothetical protein
MVADWRDTPWRSYIAGKELTAPCFKIIADRREAEWDEPE